MLVIECVTKSFISYQILLECYMIFSHIGNKTSLMYSFFVSFQYEWMALDANKDIFDTKG
jgi:hypothetical protein